MLINAFLLADKEQRARLEYWTSKEECDPIEKIREVTHIYNILGVGELCKKEINKHFLRASVLLAEVLLTDSRKHVLKEFTDSLMNRKV